MPIFEYRCQTCGKTVEKIQSQPLAEIPCPACGAKAQRAVSVFASAGGGELGGGCSVPPGSPFS